jgi:hypothetical protein
LCSSYDQLNNEYKELHGVADTLQRETADIEKSYEAQVAKARADFKNIAYKITEGLVTSTSIWKAY